ncbi:MAG: molybdenum cofactor biosynthesis protein MoaE, partial [Thermoplasmata archaeon]|nr:molybdenum cofactor biosynthesis protein MoaE [Thermoplasmata archaeon]
MEVNDTSVRVSAAPLSIGDAYREVAGRGAGGIAIFVGVVRPDRTSGGPTVALEYEADRGLAEASLERLERRARDRFGARKVVLWHRVGRLRVGEASVIVAASAAHRAAA